MPFVWPVSDITWLANLLRGYIAIFVNIDPMTSRMRPTSNTYIAKKKLRKIKLKSVSFKNFTRMAVF